MLARPRAHICPEFRGRTARGTVRQPRRNDAQSVELAQNLQQQANAYMDHPIADDTGLPGGWDFLIGWTPRAALPEAQAPAADRPAGAVVEAATPGGVSVFEAVERQLGLKLV